MEYSFIERTEEQRGRNWFGHHLRLFLDKAKEKQCLDFLSEQFGPKGKAWRFSREQGYEFSLYNSTVGIRFLHKKDAMLFKLMWDECPDPMIAIREWANKWATTHAALRGGIGVSMPPPSNPYPWFGTFAMGRNVGKPIVISQLKGRGIRGHTGNVLVIDEYGDLNWQFPKKEFPAHSIEAVKAKGANVVTTDELKHLLSTKELMRKFLDEDE